MPMLLLIACTIAVVEVTNPHGSLSLPGYIDSNRYAPTATSAIDQVANDERSLCDALLLAQKKGTLQNALTKAARDTAVGIKMREALILDSAYMALATPPRVSKPLVLKKKHQTPTHPKAPALAKESKTN